MDKPKLTKEYILDWLTWYVSSDNDFVTKYVVVGPLKEKYKEALLIELEHKDTEDLINFLTNISIKSNKKFMKNMISQLDNKMLAKMIMIFDLVDTDLNDKFDNLLFKDMEDAGNIINSIFIEYTSQYLLSELKKLLLDIISVELDNEYHPFNERRKLDIKDYPDSRIFKELEEVRKVIAKREKKGDIEELNEEDDSSESETY